VPTLFEWNLRAFGLQQNQMFFLHLDPHGDKVMWQAFPDVLLVRLPSSLDAEKQTSFIVHDEHIFLESLRVEDIHKALRAVLAILRDEKPI
jgi:hypothetical protein